ncbi:MAG: outer membrane protein transport protein [Flavobacteriaceae bacterium]
MLTSFAFAQTGHIMQGVGAVNMSMGGAATAQPLDISGALQWNPAAISVFDGRILKFDIGIFSGSPKVYSTFGPFQGSTEDDKGLSPMPAIAYVWGKEGSKHTFGVSAFGISGFGVDFPKDLNYPQDLLGNPNPNFNPNEPTNPINFPQFAGGFGNLYSDYMLLQVGFTWSYQVSEKFSIGIEPTINYGALEIGPNPLARPDFTGKGYPVSDKASSLGFGAQLGIFYDTQSGFKIGASYKTQQYFGDMEFDSKYLDGTTAPSPKFTMNYPAVYSIGFGYSKEKFDFALDYRYVDYENADGFEKSGWEIGDGGIPTGAVNGFGWKSINVISVGLQLKMIDKIPLRFGYTYSSNPIKDELAFFSMPATAVITHAFQFGFSYPINDNFTLDALYHHGISDGRTEGQMLSPMAITATNPLGKVPGTKIGYDMTTDLVMFGFTYKLGK